MKIFLLESLNQCLKFLKDKKMEMNALDLKKGQSFSIKGKRKIYLVDDIIIEILSITIYYRNQILFKKLKLAKDEIVIIH